MNLSQNTKAILLLTAPLIVARGTYSSELLTNTEYKRLARFLLEKKRQPADFLSSEGEGLLRDCQQLFDRDRLRRLLERGFLLSQAIERWETRAIWVISRADTAYPKKLKNHLKEDAPPVLYGCGDITLLDSGGLAVVGSRNVDDELIMYTKGVGKLTADAGKVLVSGGARGIDQAAMSGALNAGGKVIGVLAENLERMAMNRDNRNHLMNSKLILISAYDPNAGFNVGHAMQRNKLIYALADAALVVSSDYNKGGTWSGAVEQLDKFKFVPVYVAPIGAGTKGLEGLRRKGALVWPNPSSPNEFVQTLHKEIDTDTSGPIQGDLLSVATNCGDSSSRPLIPNALSAKMVLNPSSDPNSGDIAKELYEKVKELIFRLPGSYTESELAIILNVSCSQVKSWLKRGHEEGWIKKHGKPAMYCVDSKEQPVLF